MKRQKLSDKLSAVYAALFAAVFIILSIGVLLFVYSELTGDRRAYTAHIAALTDDHIIEELLEGETLSNPHILSEMAYDQNISILIYSPNGVIISQALNFSIEVDYFPSDLDKTHVFRTRGGEYMISCSMALEDGGEPLGTLRVVCNLRTEMSYLKLIAALLLAANCIGVALSVSAGRIVSRRMLMPINAIISEAGAIDSRNLARRLEVPEPDDELRKLAQTLNTMLDRVEDAFERQSRFTADASHELRTPLSAIQGYAEMLRRWGALEEDVRNESLGAILKQTSYMHQLIENMLLLARGDNGLIAINKERFNVQELLEELELTYSASDPTRAYSIDADPALSLFAERTMIKQLLNALLDNSRKYTPAGGSVILAARGDEHSVTLRVTDTGVGMNYDDASRAFERFYRADKARSRAVSGTGLGLSIVTTIAAMHGGTAHIDSKPGKGTTVVVTIPETEAISTVT